MEDLELLLDDQHPLLEPVTPAYSNVTVRRAFIVWMCCGQTNLFKDVCNYYHYLEALEEKLPAEKRALSRRCEFDLINNKPPMSQFLLETFPKLYSQNQKHINLARTVEEITNDKILKIGETKENELTRQNGATTEEILAASQMIRNHCKNNSVSLRNFMTEYKKYSEKCDLKYTVNNVASYIKRKMIHDELILIANTPKSFSFLNTSNQGVKENTVVTKSLSNKVNINHYEYLADKENVCKNKVPKSMRKIPKSYESLHALETSAKPFSVKNNNSDIKVLKAKSDMSNITYFDLNEDLKKLKFGAQNINNMTVLRNDKK